MLIRSTLSRCRISLPRSIAIRPYGTRIGPSQLLPEPSRPRPFRLTDGYVFHRRYQPFSSGPILQKLQREAESEEAPKSPKRKHLRSPAGKNSLRRVAVEAQRSRDVKETRSTPSEASQSTTKVLPFAIRMVKCMLMDAYRP